MSSIEHSQIKRRTTDPTNKKIENERGKYLMNLEVIVAYERTLIGFLFMNI